MAWRAQRPAVLHDAAAPPERLLQAIWRHQRLRRDGLRAADGRTVRVLHPGFWNRAAGPDFREAIIQLADEPPRSGDIEVDVEPAGWHGHGHDRNPAFSRVILQVVWRGARQNGLPTLALADVLDAPLEDLAHWLGSDAESLPPANVTGHCNAPLKELSAEQIGALLREAAMVRLRTKAEWFNTVARQIGWEQALWIGLFRALGYKHNTWPMQRVAELLLDLNTPSLPFHQFQARLLGVAGLLPAELPRRSRQAEDYVRQLWDAWWRERDRFGEHSLPRGIWRLGGLRPANHPARRLALAAHWLANGKLARNLESWFAEAVPASEFAELLSRLLCPVTDEFWSWHWGFTSRRSEKPLPLLGAARVTDLAMNAVLPWFHARAATGGNESAQRETERRWLAWPAGEDNAVLRLTRQRLFARERRWRTAGEQQGLLQIARDFCDHSNALCEHCPFPDLVRSWIASGAAQAH
ncbi:MAG: DUF2851 family protein [Pedosphaera sp.]|nr:DUF2851 family protein [Pedosphaera sp.]